MTTKIENDEANFVNGSPRHAYNDIYRCFKGDHNGLLFRCVDTSKEGSEKWYFYNDTTDTIMKVRVAFAAGSIITPLRSSRMSNVKNPETGADEIVVEVDVRPCLTEQFIEGKPNGFEMEFQTEAAPAEGVQFENGKPSKKYNKIYKCFKNSGNGLFFRCVDDSTQTWYFYNDTDGYNMVATVEFNDRSAVTPQGNTEEVGVPEDNPNGVILSITVPPLTTEIFITGAPSNYRMGFSADPVSNDLPEDPANLNYHGEGPDASIVDPNNSKIYKCFKQNDNGLLFRCVDENRNVWAYYNDTEHYTMTATVKFPEGEEYEPSSYTEVSEDPEVPSIAVVQISVPPRTTLPFITGNPKNFETSYTAVSANASKPEESPKFVNGEPDRSVMDYDQVTKVVKQQNSEDAILYRLFDSNRKKWGFYNDSNDVTVSARVKFNDGARIRKFSRTKMDSDESGEGNGFVYVIEVKPHETVEFIEGEYTNFESKFTGTRKVESK